MQKSSAVGPQTINHQQRHSSESLSITQKQRNRNGVLKPVHLDDKEDAIQAKKNLQTSKSNDGIVQLDFVENLDFHFDKKRIQIKERIMKLQKEKEKSTVTAVKPTNVTAYEPITLMQMKNYDADMKRSQEIADRIKQAKNCTCGVAQQQIENGNREEDEDEHQNLPKLTHQPNCALLQKNSKNQQATGAVSSDNDSSDSSDSDSSDSDNEVNMRAGQKDAYSSKRVLPSMADELAHALCIRDLSYFKLQWTAKDLERFHRPDIQELFEQIADLRKRMQVSAVSSKKEKVEKRLNPHQYFKTRQKLSLKKGKFQIFEHIDQNPLFLNNFGMASRLNRYFYGDRVPHKKEFQNMKSENKGKRHIGPYGQLILKQNKEKLNLLGQVDRSVYEGVTVLENKLYNAPVFYHKLPSTNTDFFCSVSRLANGERKIVVRELNHIYTMGQIEPKREVYNPQSRHFSHFIKQQSKAYIIRFLQENGEIYFQDIRYFFPNIGSPILKKGLKDIEVEQERNGICRFSAKFEEEKFIDRMTPEMVCQYESARYGQHRLEKLGIGDILGAEKTTYSTNKFCSEETDLTLQRVAKLIEAEVLQTPWNLSNNYIKIRQEGSMMLLDGPGDPSFGHGGYSFLKMPLKISADSLTGARKNREEFNPAIRNPKAVTGTSADLRKLRKKEIQEKLIQAGVSAEEVAKTPNRWKMVQLLRSLASRSDENKETGKFARGERNTSKQQWEMYVLKANFLFRKQMDVLSDLNPKFIHDLSESEPDFGSENPIHAQIGAQTAHLVQNQLSNQDLSWPANESKHVQALGKYLNQAKRRPSDNATDFLRDIHDLLNDESRKFMVETFKVPEIKFLEDVPEYLKLYLVIYPTALATQNQNPSGMNIGGVNLNAEFMSAMQSTLTKDQENALKEKLANKELSKRCEILVKKIKSVSHTKELKSKTAAASVDKDIIDSQAEKCEMQEDEEQNASETYERIIFCADDKAVRKFKRCRNKNSLKQPRKAPRGRVARQITKNNIETLNNQMSSAFGKQFNNQLLGQESFNQSVASSGLKVAARGERVGLRLKHDEEVGYLYSSKFNETDLSRSQSLKQKAKKKVPLQLEPPKPMLKLNITAGLQVQKKEESIDEERLDDINKDDQFNEVKSIGFIQQSSLQQSDFKDSQLENNEQLEEIETKIFDAEKDTEMANEQEFQFSQVQPLKIKLQVDSELLLTNEKNLEEEVKSADKNLPVENLQKEQATEPIEQFTENQSEDQKPVSSNILANPENDVQKTPPILVQDENQMKQVSQQGSPKVQTSTVKTWANNIQMSKFKEFGQDKSDFEQPKQKSGATLVSSRRRQQTPDFALNQHFQEIVQTLIDQDVYGIFYERVSKQAAPTYANIIQNPIALKDMFFKTKRNDYKNREQFLADVKLMKDNAITFNGEVSEIAKIAIRLEATAHVALEARKGEIVDLELANQLSR